MASKLKTEVRINDAFDGDGFIELTLTQEDAVFLLESLVSGEVVNISLKTPVPKRDTPLAYAS